MFFPPPLKSSAAIRAASTEPMPLVSWKMPEISLSTPIRTTLSEISAHADPPAAHDNATARHPISPLIASLPLDLFVLIFGVLPLQSDLPGCSVDTLFSPSCDVLRDRRTTRTGKISSRARGQAVRQAGPLSGIALLIR